MPQFKFKLPGNVPVDVSDTPTDQDVLTFESSSNQWLSQAAGGGGGFSTVFKTADEIINSDNTLTDDTDLNFAIDADEFFACIVCLNWAADATPDFKFSFTGPANMLGGFTVDWDDINQTILAFSSVVGGVGGGASVEKLAQINCLIKNGDTAGTFSVSWAQTNSDVADTTLFKGSWMMFKKLN